MKNFSRLIVLLSLALGALSARATSFDFSYTFDNGLVITGSLDGTANGQYVDNVSNVSLFFNGSAATGPFFTSIFDIGTSTYLNGAIVSFDATLNNFAFTSDDINNGGGDTGFVMLDAFNGGGLPISFAYNIPEGIAGNDVTNAARWSLTAATSTNVPDSTTTAGLLGLSTLVLVALRRRR